MGSEGKQGLCDASDLGAVCAQDLGALKRREVAKSLQMQLQIDVSVCLVTGSKCRLNSWIELKSLKVGYQREDGIIWYYYSELYYNYIMFELCCMDLARSSFHQMS